MKLFPEAIARRRDENDDYTWLSDWQVHSAHITAGAISSLACGHEAGPLYVPMPTGSGKTIGAIWGVVDFAERYPDQRLCFLTPYQGSVDNVYRQLVEKLGADRVGHYHSEAGTNKEEVLAKPIVVLTHQFIQYNHGRLDDRDLFVVDEAIYATGEASLKREHFNQARSWATSHNVLPDEFLQLDAYTHEMDQRLQASNQKYVAAPHEKNLDWAKAIAFDLDIRDHYQTIQNSDVIVGAQRFCEALLEGLVFLSKGNIDSERWDPVYSAAVFGIPRIDKTVVLSATGGMVYDIAGPFKQSEGSKLCWSPPSYEKLKLVHLTGPVISGHYGTWTTTSKKDQVARYVDWVLSQVEENKIYMTMPKKVLEKCLRDYFGLPATGDLEYPFTVTKHGKQISVSNHARSVGSNDFRDCGAVVYLWDNHLPSSVAVQRFHTLAGEEVTEEALEDANKGNLAGNYERIRDAQYIDNMMQHIGRGKVRDIDKNAVAGEMTAYVHTDVTKFQRLAIQYKNCTTAVLEFEGEEAGKPSDRISQILWFIKEHDRQQDIPISEVEEAVGFNLRGYADRLEANWDLKHLGYEFVRGGRGRGNAGHFRWLGDS